MNRKQKPVLIVAVILSGLILLPALLWVVSKIGGVGCGSGPSNGGSGAVSSSGGAVVDYELRQLAERADELMQGALADAAQNRDIPLDVMADFTRQLTKAQSDLGSGKLSRAKERFEGFIAEAEGRLESIALANRARELKNGTYLELQRLGHLKSAFENTYEEAVVTYDKASLNLEADEFAESLDGFELAQAILGDLEARAIQRVATLLEQAGVALDAFEPRAAKEAFEAALEIAPDNLEASEGLEIANALEGISEEIREIIELEEAGQTDEALVRLERLAVDHPNNGFIERLREAMLARQIEKKFAALIAQSIDLEEAGDLSGAIQSVEEALGLKEDSDQIARLAELKKKLKAIRLEELLAGGFAALKSGRYESARDIYKEAVALAPESSEARTGLEKASSLFLASVRYTQSIRGVQRRLEEGRFPLAAKLFNQALASRPATLSPEAQQKEEEIRSILETQSAEVSVSLTSDKRTHVSIIGVLPPERFKSMDLKLYPDVYKIRGTRQGYRTVEIELKADALRSGQTIHIQCTERI